ncbi:Fur family transcriptional regulator [Hufsiella ginkgonis]|uniref:Transcriptional repressor n=1 Tax=Hufsiella ginkgonis TaxID=2695274 RepID=A0A7K1XU62_9SPHI|nr:transcriptional repressor [Hufsiella ginkgonis]MXV14553.1 transcriptional repressor [Hufsiella ginkgonis]
MTRGIEEKLTSRHVTPTAMRLLVLDYLEAQPAAVSLSDIERGLAPADRITIYRTLKTFEENGIAHSIEDGTGSPKYALCHENCNAGAHHDLHVHFYCSACKETFCLPKSVIPEVSLPGGFTAREVNLVVKGTCAACQA